MICNMKRENEYIYSNVIRRKIVYVYRYIIKLLIMFGGLIVILLYLFLFCKIEKKIVLFLIEKRFCYLLKYIVWLFFVFL